MTLEAAGMVTWEWDIASGVIAYSENVSALAAGDVVEPYGTVSGLLHMIHPDDREALAQALQRTEAEGVPFECEYRVRMLDGAYHWILGRGKTVVTEAGRPIRVLGISQDITVRKQAADELQKRSQQLAQLAGELTLAEHRERRRLAELLHDGLQQALVGASLEVESLLARAAEAQRQALENLRRSLGEALDSARAITQQLAPPIPLQRQLPDAFHWLARDVQTRYQCTVAVLARDIPPAVPEAVVVALYAAARELLLNVVKHAGSNAATLSLRGTRDTITMEVRDTGGGFDPRTIQASSGSHGFGLFGIRERIELLGGSFAIYSTPGSGTRVNVSLPLAPTPCPTAAAPPPATETPTARAPHPAARASARTNSTDSTRATRILFVDDHRAVREGMIGLLQTHDGLTVVGEADNGRDAVVCVERLQPDVVIMDVSMPVMDGVEATRIIKQRWPDVKVIGLSMYDDTQTLARMRHAGADDYVTKSAAAEQLLSAIHRCTAPPRQQPERRQTPSTVTTACS